MRLRPVISGTDVAIQIVSSNTNAAWTFTVPSGVSEGASYKVVIVYGSGEVVSSGTFTIMAQQSVAPTITSFSPTSGNPTATIVTISGSGFGSTQGSSLLQLVTGAQTQNVTPATWSATSITFAIPSFPAGAYQVKVVVAGQTATALTNLTINAAALVIELRANGAGSAFANGTATNSSTGIEIRATSGSFPAPQSQGNVKVTMLTFSDSSCNMATGEKTNSNMGLPFNGQNYTSTLVPLTNGIASLAIDNYLGYYKLKVAITGGSTVTAPQCLLRQ